MLALVAPGLLVAGAPWRRLGLGRPATALAEARRRHPERVRSGAVGGARPGRHGRLADRRRPSTPCAPEAGWWPLRLSAWAFPGRSCGSSASVAARWSLVAARTQRIAVAAVSMWTIWVLAYLVAMSDGDWYRAYVHVAGRGLSQAIDQQISAGVMWAVASACFVPVIFFNLSSGSTARRTPTRRSGAWCATSAGVAPPAAGQPALSLRPAGP